MLILSYVGLNEGGEEFEGYEIGLIEITWYLSCIVVMVKINNINLGSNIFCAINIT